MVIQFANYLKRSFYFKMALGLVLFVKISGAQTPNIQISGEVVQDTEKGFAIKIPQEWGYEKNTGGGSLLIKPSKVETTGFSPNLQVSTYSEPHFIDELTAAEFMEKMQAKILATNPSIQNFHYLDNTLISLENGNKAILFYSEFDLLDKSFMQAQVLTSSNQDHYVLSFVDFKENFQGDNRKKYFEPAWGAIQSFASKTPPPTRSDFFYRYVIPIAGIFTLFFFIRIFYLFRSGRKYSKMLLEMEVFSDESDVSLNPNATNTGPKMLSKHPHHDDSIIHSQMPISESKFNSVQSYPDSVMETTHEMSLITEDDWHDQNTKKVS